MGNAEDARIPEGAEVPEGAVAPEEQWLGPVLRRREQ
ncbi:TIGR00730 family Rossman fold protein, partial [Streptomyces sp. SID8455]|nr:TIGR00730 family Rossman fold protein [Streptomyces sp. SID8455]